MSKQGVVRRLLGAAVVLALAAGAGAAPRVPASDDVIVEALPSIAGWSREERRLRRELAQRPRDEGVAIAAAQAYLDLARSQGDARYAGHAMGALQAWEQVPASATPPGVLVMRATVAQFLHDFDGAEAALKMALARQPSHAQAWITLATVMRVRGRYAESDTACRALARVAPALYGIACLAENAGLRGEHAAARQALQGLLAEPALADPRRAGIRQWLLTSMAELEERAGRAIEAERAYRKALDAERASYTLLAYSDFLLRGGRAAEVPVLLEREARSDAVLLRLAMAAGQGATQGKDSQELQARFDAAALRPGTRAVHAREEALFALDLRQDAPRALALARINVQRQREPIDLLLFARAAVAAHDDSARREVKTLLQQTGLRDARIDAIL
jgi:tetratricopeptide (TPR) repeat protein